MQAKLIALLTVGRLVPHTYTTFAKNTVCIHTHIQDVSKGICHLGRVGFRL